MMPSLYRHELLEDLATRLFVAPAPGFEEVLVPGEVEFRALGKREVEGIPLDDVSRDAILQQAEKLSVDTKELFQEE